MTTTALPGSIVHEVRGTPQHKRNTEGAFIDLPDGRLMFAWSRFGTGGNDDSEAVIAARYSADGGRTWSDDSDVLVRPQGALNVMCVSFLKLRDGRIALFHLLKKGYHDCRLVMRTSSDGARTWSDPTLCIPAPGYHVVNNDRVVRLSSGRIIAPSSFHRRRSDSTTEWAAFDPRGLFMCYFSDDEGKTWRESETWVALPQPLPYAKSRSEGLEEPGIVELKDGRLFAWARTTVGHQYGMYSEDDGDTWSAPQPTQFISPNAPMTIKRIPKSGHLLAIWNDHSGVLRPKPEWKGVCTDRWPLVSAISRDEGKTWENHKVIDDQQGKVFAYTSMYFPDEEQVLLAYWVQNDQQVHGGFTDQRLRLISAPEIDIA